MGIQGELGISTYPASHDTSMAAFNSKTPTTGYMFACSRHTPDWRGFAMLHGSHLEKVSTPDKIFIVDQLKTIQETQTDTHRAIKYHYKRGSIRQCSENHYGTMRKRLHKYASHFLLHM